MLPICLSNLRAIVQFWTQISRLLDFARSYNKTSFWIFKRGPGLSPWRLFRFSVNDLFFLFFYFSGRPKCILHVGAIRKKCSGKQLQLICRQPYFYCLKNVFLPWTITISLHRSNWHETKVSKKPYVVRANSMFAPSQWETVLFCNDVSHWQGANLESALCRPFHTNIYTYNPGYQCKL